MQLPLTAYELIDLLDTMFPEVIYDPEDSKEAFLLKSGERRLVRFLRGLKQAELQERHV